ncbi:unnamed protein product [Onchocerca flexuosa]|uniref:Kazal-like domain-containing protein n=1 Tax=Onchocerca flexuosa TaxID=387005 RepID=A0A183HND5_9BILA|nr:unnamed protein product [Onchocerca flexuosa]
MAARTFAASFTPFACQMKLAMVLVDVQINALTIIPVSFTLQPYYSFAIYGFSGTICATDGITYRSECHMRLAACQQQKFIVIAFRGSCDSCSNVACLDGQQCEDGICSCPSSCPDSAENSTV